MRARRVAWAIWAVTLLGTALGVTLIVVNRTTAVPPSQIGYNGSWSFAALAFIALAFASVGALVASRRPGNAIGWRTLPATTSPPGHVGATLAGAPAPRRSAAGTMRALFELEHCPRKRATKLSKSPQCRVSRRVAAAAPRTGMSSTRWWTRTPPIRAWRSVSWPGREHSPVGPLQPDCGARG